MIKIITGWYFVYNRVAPGGKDSKDTVRQEEILLLGQTEEKALEEAGEYWEVIQETEKEDRKRREENGLPTLPNTIFFGVQPNPHIVRKVSLLLSNNKR